MPSLCGAGRPPVSSALRSFVWSSPAATAAEKRATYMATRDAARSASWGERKIWFRNDTAAYDAFGELPWRVANAWTSAATTGVMARWALRTSSRSWDARPATDGSGSPSLLTTISRSAASRSGFALRSDTHVSAAKRRSSLAWCLR